MHAHRGKALKLLIVLDPRTSEHILRAITLREGGLGTLIRNRVFETGTLIVLINQKALISLNFYA